jgi:hypothetical protein
MGVWLRHCKGAFKKHVFPRLCRPTKPAPPCPKAAAEEKEGGREDGLGGRGGRELVACPPRTRCHRGKQRGAGVKRGRGGA